MDMLARSESWFSLEAIAMHRFKMSWKNCLHDRKCPSCGKFLSSSRITHDLSFYFIRKTFEESQFLDMSSWNWSIELIRNIWASIISFIFYKHIINIDILQIKEFVNSLFIMIVTLFMSWNPSRNLKDLLYSKMFWRFHPLKCLTWTLLMLSA